MVSSCLLIRGSFSWRCNPSSLNTFGAGNTCTKSGETLLTECSSNWMSLLPCGSTQEAFYRQHRTRPSAPETGQSAQDSSHIDSLCLSSSRQRHDNPSPERQVLLVNQQDNPLVNQQDNPLLVCLSLPLHVRPSRLISCRPISCRPAAHVDSLRYQQSTGCYYLSCYLIDNPSICSCSASI
jgi:hypothetical protein